MQIARHAQFGKADIGAVEVRDDVEDEDQRQHAPSDFTAQRDWVNGQRGAYH